MKSFSMIVLMLLLTACNVTVKQTPGPVDHGYQQQHTQVDFDLYPACVGSCQP